MTNILGTDGIKETKLADRDEMKAKLSGALLDWQSEQLLMKGIQIDEV